MKRPMPSSMSFFYEQMKKHKLSCPFGRAAYLTNRLLNGDGQYPRVHTFQHPYSKDYAIERSKAIRLDTAIRWADHWDNGGSLKALCYTKESWLEKRRNRYAEELATLTLQVKADPEGHRKNIEQYCGVREDGTRYALKSAYPRARQILSILRRLDEERPQASL